MASFQKLVGEISDLARETGDALQLRGFKAGGTTGQVPKKNSNTDFDWSWGDAAGGNLTGAVTSVGTATSLGSFTIAQLSTAISDANISGTNTGDQTITLTGDITGSGTGSFVTTLATVNSNVGSFTNGSFTVNAKGLITAASSGTAPVTSVTGTANQITVTGTTTPTLSLSATITGLTSVTSTTFVGALTGTASGNLVSGGDAGTPSAIVLTNATGTAAGLTAGNATTLATARTINGVSFNGSANIGQDLQTTASPTFGASLSLVNGANTATLSSAFGNITVSTGDVRAGADLRAIGVLRLGVSADAGIERSAANTVAITNGAAGGTGNLLVRGTLAVTGASTLTGDVTAVANLICSTVGKGLQIKGGSALARAGNATLVAGTVTVANTTITANSIIYLTRKTSGGTIGMAVTYTLSAATSFTITSDSALDTSVYSFLIIELN